MIHQFHFIPSTLNIGSLEVTNQNISITEYNTTINAALLYLFPREIQTVSILLYSNSSINSYFQKKIQTSGLIFIELSFVIDTNLNIITELLNIKSDLHKIGLNAYIKKSYSNRILEMGAKGYNPMHCFPTEFENAIETVPSRTVFEYKFTQKIAA